MYLDHCFGFFDHLSPEHRRAVFLALGNTRLRLIQGSWFGAENEKEVCCPLIMAIAAIRLVAVSELRRELLPLGNEGIVQYVANFFRVRTVQVSVFFTRWDRSHCGQGLRLRRRMAAEVYGTNSAPPQVDRALVYPAAEAGRTAVGVSVNEQFAYA